MPKLGLLLRNAPTERAATARDARDSRLSTAGAVNENDANSCIKKQMHPTQVAPHGSANTTTCPDRSRLGSSGVMRRDAIATSDGPGGHGHVLLAADREADGIAAHGRADVRLPEHLARLVVVAP